MKRRSFLQGIGAGIAALVVPTVAAKKYPFTRVTVPYASYDLTNVDAVFHGEPLASEFVPVGSAHIFSGDVCILENGAYRRAMVSDDVNVFGSRVAIAVPNGNGGFNFMRYPECMDVVWDIEIRGGTA